MEDYRELKVLPSEREYDREQARIRFEKHCLDKRPVWHMGEPVERPLLSLVDGYRDNLEKELVKYYKKNISWRMFFLHKLPLKIVSFFVKYKEVKEYKFEYTLSAAWDQSKDMWVHSGDSRRGPDWRISLPWRKATRGFPKHTRYLKNSIEMKLGYGLAKLSIDVLDSLMFEMASTSWNIHIVNGDIKVSIDVIENVKKINCA